MSSRSAFVIDAVSCVSTISAMSKGPVHFKSNRSNFHQSLSTFVFQKLKQVFARSQLSLLEHMHHSLLKYFITATVSVSTGCSLFSGGSYHITSLKVQIFLHSLEQTNSF